MLPYVRDLRPAALGQQLRSKGLKSRGPLFQTNSLGAHRSALKFGSQDASRGVKDCSNL